MGSLEIKTPHLAAFIARRNSGKSHLQKYLLHCLAGAQRFASVLVISPTKFTGFWGEVVDDANVRESLLFG